MTPAWLAAAPGGCVLRIKAVPGASRAGVAGPLGDRLKVRIAEPPEGGRANRAIEELLGALLGCRCRVVGGHGVAQKTVLAEGAEPGAVVRALAG
jgi:uncharacterized protein YggU (UPF0235/DUF167 family)